MSQTATCDIAVLIPCFNEAPTIAKVVGDFRRALPEATVFVFDNNSTDATAELAQQAGAIVIREKRQGKGYVVAAMLEKIDARYYLMVDGDDTYPAECARELLTPVIEDRADMVVGRRQAADLDASYPRFHVFGNWLVRTLINVIFGSTLTDIMSGYRAFNRMIARNMPILAIGFDIETEITLQCLYRRWIIRELPVSYRPRPPGSVSKLNTFSDGLRVLFRILNLFRSYKPLTFFGSVGIVFFLVALAAAVWGAGLETTANRAVMFIAAGVSMVTSLISIGIGVTVQLVNFRFLELDSVLRRKER